MSRNTNISLSKTPSPEQLLLSRRDVAAALGVSYHQIVLLEEAGTLRAVRLSSGAKAKAYYRRADVVALTEKYSEPFSNELKHRASRKRQRSS
ncbi:hypothetical protein [Bradyrhizobium liaoningense]|uniref:hypothetical protein n=1 Tax=Bradyrhizobium liaoningense TaxID=43992 RepID=UPI001BA54910|nr:hypothetical protein [Bradyrhizobium liaoningense]MBR0986532.1 hypothetical protein [Bradyrhizobium liaoningense]